MTIFICVVMLIAGSIKCRIVLNLYYSIKIVASASTPFMPPPDPSPSHARAWKQPAAPAPAPDLAPARGSRAGSVRECCRAPAPWPRPRCSWDPPPPCRVPVSRLQRRSRPNGDVARYAPIRALTHLLIHSRGR
jgi:hypothetical protein